MIKFLSFTILVVSSAVLFSGCIKIGDSNSARESVFLDDGHGGQNSGEVILDESAVKDAETQVSIERNSFQEDEQTETDGTKISTMYDGFGNKIERRFFYQHPILNAVVLRTSANGQREVLLFGHNGEVKAAPQNVIDNAMIASADELAKAAGIIEGHNPKVPFPGFTEPENETALSSPTVSDFSQVQNTEQKNVKTEPVKRQEAENQQIKTAPQNVQSLEIEYQSEINKLNLRAKNSKTAKDIEDR